MRHSKWCYKVVAAIVIAFMIVNLSLLYLRNAPETSEALGYESADPTTVAIIYGYMRSGSTFLADVIDHHPDAFYLHEPTNHFYYVPRGTNQPTVSYPNVTRTLMSAMAHCNFEVLGQGWLDYMLDGRLFMLARSSAINEYLANLEPVCPPGAMISPGRRVKCRGVVLEELTADDINVICRNRSLRFAKFVRGELVDYLSAVAGDRRSKLIHLVRDPRAVVASRQRLHWDGIAGDGLSHDPVRSMARDLCRLMSRDHLVAERWRRRNAANYLRLRYEDLVQNFEAEASRLFAFLARRRLDPRVKEHVTRLWAGTEGPREESFNTVRRSPTRLVQAWHHNLTPGDVTIINTECSEALKNYGYS